MRKNHNLPQLCNKTMTVTGKQAEDYLALMESGVNDGKDKLKFYVHPRFYRDRKTFEFGHKLRLLK